jgi:hypothetical protein
LEELKVSSYNLKLEKDLLLIELSRCIDENSIFNDLKAEKYSKIVVDFKNVFLMNSCGIREWVKFVSTINENQLVIYKNCSYLVIDTMVAIPPFSTNKTLIESVQINWECETKNLNLTTIFEIDSDILEESIHCENCPEPMTTEFDWPDLIEIIRQKNLSVKK